MKFGIIRLVSNSQKGSDASLEEFTRNEHAKSALGELLIALAGEEAWSKEYAVSGYFQNDEHYLIITHPAFLDGRSRITIQDDGMEWSLQRVEQIVEGHLRTSGHSLEMGIRALQQLAQTQLGLAKKIQENKARAAIRAIFPDATHLDFLDASDELWAFTPQSGKEFYVVRRVAGEFIGGVAKFNLSPGMWYDQRKKLEAFWAQIARQFAVKELNAEEQEFRCHGVAFGDEKIEFVALLRKGERVAVYFRDGLPVRVR
ncbi:MAG TPA: hypothetical protein VF829_00605 [Candidatus Paceibacterota bacterium]